MRLFPSIFHLFFEIILKCIFTFELGNKQQLKTHLKVHFVAFLELSILYDLHSADSLSSCDGNAGVQISFFFPENFKDILSILSVKVYWKQQLTKSHLKVHLLAANWHLVSKT